MIRIGTVSSRDTTHMAVRVAIEDQDDLVTDWLPVVVPQTSQIKDYAVPFVGERVVCLFLSNGIESGFCMGSIYTDTTTPPTTNGSKRGTWFPGGNYVEFDTSTGILSVEASGNVRIKAPSSTIEGNLSVDGNVRVTGNLIVDGSITRGGETL